MKKCDVRTGLLAGFITSATAVLSCHAVEDSLSIYLPRSLSVSLCSPMARILQPRSSIQSRCKEAESLWAICLQCVAHGLNDIEGVNF